MLSAVWEQAQNGLLTMYSYLFRADLYDFEAGR